MNILEIICSKQNIYKSIYSLESYIFEKDLLSKNDKELLYRLSDKYNLNLIEDVINDVQLNIKNILNDKDKLFEVEVYFRAKGYKENDIEFRPIHTSSLINQISMVSILNILLYEFVIEEDKISGCNLSSISNLIPNNFYGNIPSEREGELFRPWQQMYKKYSEDSSEIFSRAYNNSEFKYELTLDIEKFFPSINPYVIYSFILDKVSIQYSDDDIRVVKMAIYKLLNFKVINIDVGNEIYYGEDGEYLEGDLCISKGVAQGLPQSYFFGNICMIDIAKIFAEELGGKSLFYVDDSYIYTNDLSDDYNIDFEKKIKKINSELVSYFKINIDDIDKEYRAFSEEICMFHNQIQYKIKVHDAGKKSQCCVIKENINKSTLFLKSLTRQASMGASEMNNVMSDVDDITLSNKFDTIEQSIDSQIRKMELDLDELHLSQLNYGIKNKNKERIYNNSIKKLVRLSKFLDLELNC